MSYVFAWHNLIFLIPLSLGILLVLGASIGVIGDTDGDVNVDGEADVDADSDVEASDFVIEVLSLLGVGRVPLSIVMLTASLVFGASGFIANVWLEPELITPMAYAPISAAIAFVLMVGLTGRIAALVSKVFPTTESYTISKTDLLGRIGTLVLPTSEATGLLQVNDHEGNLHQGQCRSRDGALSKGSKVLVVDWLEDEDAYLVEMRPSCLDDIDALDASQRQED